MVYKGTRFYNGDRALKVKRWLHRVAEDASGLTFEEWDPTKDIDNTQPPVPMIINSSELRGAGFNLQEVIPPALEVAARSGRRTRGAGVRQVEGLGRKRFVLSADDDSDLRSLRECVSSRYLQTAQMSCLATSMCEITNLLYPSAGVKESTVAHSFSALFL